MLKKGKVLICREGDSPDIAVRIGVREGKLYMLEGKHCFRSKGILNGPMLVTKDEE